MATRSTTPRSIRRVKHARPAAAVGGSFAESFPNSTKVYVEGPEGVRVPMREIALSEGEPPLRVYDTSGPQGFDVREGLPALRADWISDRPVTLTPSAAKGRGPGPNGSTKGGSIPAPSVAALPQGDNP
jgi:phosphomethylpyrimidine synthase